MKEGSNYYKPRFDCSYFIIVEDSNGCIDTSTVYFYGEQ